MQAITEFSGDVDAVLNEMKRRAHVSTDTQLAKVIGTSQSNVSTWRKRGAVPKAALLKFERRLADGQEKAPLHVASLMVAYRLAEYWAAKAAGPNIDDKRWIILGTLATAHSALIDAIKKNIVKKQNQSGLTPLEIASELIRSETFLEQLYSWVKELSLEEIVRRSI